MDKITVFKASVIAFFTAITAWLGTLAIPVYILVTTNIIDYSTGIAAAKYRGQKINSRIGFWGAAKKIFMWLLVVVGCIIDALILYLAGNVGIAYNLTFVFGSLVAVWLAINEIISILENLVDMDMGKHIPSWLMPLVQNLHSKVDKKVKEVSNEQNKSKE